MSSLEQGVRMWVRPMQLGLLALATCLAACGFVRDVPIAGPFRLVAVDVPEDRILCRTVGAESDCSGDGLPGPTVFKAGVSDRFVVFARHPRRQPELANKSVSEFDYLIRSASNADPLSLLNVIGPMGELEFEREKQRLRLPEFSKVFEDLR